MPDSRDAIALLITQHLPLVGHVARETAARLPRHLGTDDLIGAGSLALVQAAHAFDPALGVPFARFANTRVRGAMIDSMRQRDWASRTVRTRSKAIDSASETLTAGLGRRPTATELAAACGRTGTPGTAPTGRSCSASTRSPRTTRAWVPASRTLRPGPRRR